MRQTYLVFKYNPLFGKCPLCQDHKNLHRAQERKISEFLLISVPLYRLYRCGSCGWRGYLFTLIFSKKSLIDLFLYTGLAAVSCLLLIQVLSRLSR